MRAAVALALAARVGSVDCEALTGAGYAALEEGNATASVEIFRVRGTRGEWSQRYASGM